MANRTARLRREQEALVQQETFRKALRASKQRRRLQRSPAALCREVEQYYRQTGAERRDELRAVLRRKSVTRALGANSGFFLTVLHCLDMGLHWRALTQWRAPRSRNPARIFESLSAYVFVRYAMPAPLRAALVRAVVEENNSSDPAIAWFFHVARGENLSRAAGLPFEFTKKAAHFFGEAPAGMPVLKAMRWAQVRAMGGAEAYARAFADALDRPYEGFEPEWSAVIRFVVQHAEAFQPDTVRRVVEFIRYQRLETKTVEAGYIEESVEALYPDFDIRQATPASLLARVVTWEKHVRAVAASLRHRPFPPVRQGDVREFVTAMGLVQVRRLKNLAELITEGTQMRHCVATYGPVCMSGEHSIWSFTAENGRYRLATLQLSKSGEIIQVQGKANSLPPREVYDAVEQWVKADGLEW